MGKSTDKFRQLLTQLLDSGKTSKTELHIKTGLSRPTLDRYLRKTPPDLDALDKIAEALECDPGELIRADANALPHSLNDCLDTLVQAFAEAKLGHKVPVEKLYPPTTAVEADEIERKELKGKLERILDKFDELDTTIQEHLLEEFEDLTDSYMADKKKSSNKSDAG